MASEQKERMQRGELYLPSDPEISADRLRCQLALERFNAISATDEEARRELLRGLLGTLGNHATIWPPFRCDYGYNVHMGDGSFINYNSVILDGASVRIGRDVQIGPNLQIMTPVHPLDATARRESWESAKPVTIEDDVWLAAGVIVLPGVTIGEGAVVGAGSVVTRDLPPRVLAVGNPCRVVREIEIS
jgi:maltose O-acetyltransferase